MDVCDTNGRLTGQFLGRVGTDTDIKVVISSQHPSKAKPGPGSGKADGSVRIRNGSVDGELAASRDEVDAGLGDAVGGEEDAGEFVGTAGAVHAGDCDGHKLLVGALFQVKVLTSSEVWSVGSAGFAT
jgi:hypothetical protein